MPLPKPQTDETQDEFLQRCTGDDLMNEEYTDTDQRYAICLAQWQKKAHPHGEHLCVCPECSSEISVKEDVKCNTQKCPECGAKMRAKEIGEKRQVWRFGMETKTLNFEVKEIDEEAGIFEGYAATFSKTPDNYGDVIEKGAFKQTLKDGGKRVKILWNHNVMEPIGKPLELNEDEVGLHIKGQLSLGVQRAREVLSLMKDGVITEMSIGYDTITEGWEKGIRHLRELRLWDASPVTFAANPEASITGVKADLEHLLKSGRVLSATNKDKVQAAINALQALLDNADDNDSSKSTQEPAPTTPEPEKVKEAAELEGILSSIEAELAHFDTKAAEARIDQLLEKITTEVKTNA